MGIPVFVLSNLIAHYMHFFQSAIFIQPEFPHERQTCNWIRFSCMRHRALLFNCLLRHLDLDLSFKTYFIPFNSSCLPCEDAGADSVHLTC